MCKSEALQAHCPGNPRWGVVLGLGVGVFRKFASAKFFRSDHAQRPSNNSAFEESSSYSVLRGLTVAACGNDRYLRPLQGCKRGGKENETNAGA